MSKPWGVVVGAWAADSEREEAEEKAAMAAAATAAPVEPQSFPSLREGANAKTGKKKKNTTMNLRDFQTGGAGVSKGLTPDEMMRLPTGPKEYSADEMPYSGRGFSSSSSSSYGRQGMGGVGGDGSWGGGGGGRRPYGGGFEEERNSRVSDSDQMMPSRADEADNWKTEKKPLPSFDSGRQSQSQSRGSSRADEVDNWGFGKKRTPVPVPVMRSDGGEKERPRLVLDARKGGSSEAPAERGRGSKASPFGAARPREEVLADKGLDWKKMDSQIDAKKASSDAAKARPTSSHSESAGAAKARPTSSHSESAGAAKARPTSSHSESAGAAKARPTSSHSESADAAKARPKVNPFGDAKPREVLLQQQGKDWRKIDLDLDRRRLHRPETEEEKTLKEEIENLKKEPCAEDPSLQDRILQREAELEQLTRDLDAKMRFAQKPAERPGSGAGRAYHERPPSQSGAYEDSRSSEFMERPRSRGTAEVWSRPGDDRRGFQGGGGVRERGFLGSRDLDRSRSRERW